MEISLACVSERALLVVRLNKASFFRLSCYACQPKSKGTDVGAPISRSLNETEGRRSVGGGGGGG